MHQLQKAKPHKKKFRRQIFYFILGTILGLVFLLIWGLSAFENKYKARAYPGVSIARYNFTGQTQDDVKNFWLARNFPYQSLQFTLIYEEFVATISGEQLDLGFDATLSGIQALAVGRSGSFLTDVFHKYQAFTEGINLKPFFRFKETELDNTLESLALAIDIPAENALFEFQGGKVTLFKPAKSGRSLNTREFKKKFFGRLEIFSSTNPPNTQITFNLPVVPLEPLIQTEDANDFGIRELIGQGESFFKGSIPGRIHNITLAASRINGVLIPPGKIFSFNETVGDISAATGYKQAYVIKSGRTVLDDGGGVCQVSTTFFRAALNSGLPINERHAHSYRVGYYEQGGWKPGFDATVYAPSYDLKVLNDTPAYILIQSNIDLKNQKLTFELYGKKDGRKVEISPVRLWDSRPAPPDLYQDDPTLPSGTVKQVDWANPGIKAEFDYLVTRNGEEIIKQKFFSNFIPWQAVFLRGTGPAQ